MASKKNVTKKAGSKKATAKRGGAKAKAKAKRTSAGKAVKAAGISAVGAASASGSTDPTVEHQQSEDVPWAIAIPGHEPRTDSPEYVQSRAALKAVTADPSAQRFLYPLIKDSKDSYQDHHGGGMWVHDDEGFLFIKNIAGMEWSSQFCADPAKVDKLRQFAKRVYRAFPGSLEEISKRNPKIGTAAELQKMLDTPITDAKGIAAWVDSIFNASVPLDAPHHTGFITSKASLDVQGGAAGGVHHYPTPITDIQFFKHDDFRLWVTDPQGKLAAVVPKSPRGSGDGAVRVAYATPGTKLHKALLTANKGSTNLVVSADSPMAKQAFAEQSKPSKNGARNPKKRR
jgi:Family of unknown function (DUF6424)